LSPQTQTVLWRLGRWTGGIIAGLVLCLALMLWTGPGHRLIEWLAFRLTDGEVRVEGLDGALPGHVTARSVELRDAGGPWLRVIDADVTWSPLAALSHHYEVLKAAAAKVELLRRPLPSKPSEGPPPRIDVYDLSLPHIDIAPAILGHPAMLAARGSLNYTTIHEFGVDLAITRPGGTDHYAAKGYVAANLIHGHAEISESPDGLFGKLAGLPGLGPIALSADASGDRNRNEVAFDLKAGALTAQGKGILSLASGHTDLDFSAASSAMQLDAETGWASLAAEGHVHGAFATPQIDAALHLAQVHAAGLVMDGIVAQAHGQSGMADATATVTGVHLPGRYSDLFAARPVAATLHADLTAATRPLRFTIHHPLLNLDGTAQTAGARSANVTLTVPSLAPFAAQVGTDLDARATLNVGLAWAGQKFTLDMQGGVRAKGTSVLARMLGPDARLSFHTLVSGSDMQDSHVQMQGAGFNTRIDGSLRAGRMDFRVDTGLTDLARLTPVLDGTIQLSGTVSGEPARAAIALSGTADMASRGFKRQRIAFNARATGLPNPKDARVTGNGRFDDAPFTLAADWKEAGSGHAANLTLEWKSLAARADLSLSAKGAIAGHAALGAKDMNDLASFAGMPLRGGLNATADLASRNGKEQISLHLSGHALGVSGVALDVLQADGAIADAFVTPHLDMHLVLQGLATSGITGSAKAQLAGPLEALVATLDADLKDSDAQPAHLSAEAVAQVPKSQVRLDHLAADWRGQGITLVQPATFNLAGGVAVDRLDLKAAGGTLHAAGRISPKLAISVSAANVQLSALRAFAPQLAADGMADAKADLAGTLAAPTGSVTVNARGLRVAGYSNKLAPAELSATAQLDGSMAQLHAKLAAGGTAALTLDGAAPLSADRMMNLHAAGNADLSLLNPLLAVDGRQAQGRVTLDMTATGVMAAPRLSGTASLAGAEYQDYVQGLRIHDIAAEFRADGSVVHVEKFQGQAGPGTIGGSGTLDIGQPGWPLDLSITARNARPIASDMVIASLSGDLKLVGRLRQAMTLSGKLTVPRADINIPDSFPPEVRTLNIRRRGEKAPPPPPAVTTLALDLSVAATGPVIVRGHGVDADLGGELQLTGTSGAPRVGGGFEMRRGTLTVAGQVLDFTTGKVSFDGSGVRNRLDPTLNFVAQTSSGGVTATLTVGGYASAPKISLSSSPQLPQDEVLAHLLFQQSAKQLTPLQLAQIAQGLAALSGISNGFDPVASVRGGLGLDRLAVSGGSGVTTGTTVEAGKYVSHNIYVGARQGLSGGTQAQVQLDITRTLKAQATISTGTSATATQGATGQDSGSSIGLSYQFEY
jgi:translocation and assembly module TamB